MDASEGGGDGRLTIFHTSDLHNRLNETLADRLRNLKRNASSSLLLDSGDALWAGNAFWRPGGEPVLDLMSSVPYDAMCMGNREFHFLDTGIRAKISRAAFPILSANLRASNRDALAVEGGLEDYVRFERSGLRVIVFGLTVPCVPSGALLGRLCGVCHDDPVQAGVKMARWLRPECDVLVALTHIGIRRDIELSRAAPEIDIILGGHSHTVTERPVKEEGGWILHCGAHARLVCRVDLAVESSVRIARHDLIPLTEGAD